MSFTDPNAAQRQRALHRLQLQIDVCSQLNAQALVGLILRSELSSDLKLREQQLRWISENLRVADAYAAKSGVKLALEPLNRYESNYLNRCEDMVDLITNNDLRSCGILIDTFHMNIEEISLCDAITLSAGLLSYVHLPDSNRWHPGAGHLDLLAVLRSLQNIGYQGYVAMEMLPLPDPQTAAARALQHTRQLVESLE